MLTLALSAFILTSAAATAVQEPRDPVADGRPSKEERVREIVHEIRVYRHALARHLLTPDPRHVQRHADLLERPDTGIARVLADGWNHDEFTREMPMQGGGAYYSFARRSHDFGNGPDLHYTGGVLLCGNHSRQTAMLVSAEIPDLLALPTEAEPLPEPIGGVRPEAWRMLWSPIEAARVDSKERLRRMALGRATPVARPGASFLLRVRNKPDYDHLVAFTVVDVTDDDCTLVWRRLHEWPMERATASEELDAPPPVPDDVAELDPIVLVDEIALLREEGQQLVLSTPLEARNRYRSHAGRAADAGLTRGMTRLFRKARSREIFPAGRGATRYSFATESHDYDVHPDLELRRDRLACGFAGENWGWLLDLGVLDETALLRVTTGQPPKTFTEEERARFDLLWNVVPVVGRKRYVGLADASRAARIGLSDRATDILGHTYVLRTVAFDSHDHLVLFTVVEADEDGCVLAWHLLRTEGPR